MTQWNSGINLDPYSNYEAIDFQFEHCLSQNTLCIYHIILLLLLQFKYTRTHMYQHDHIQELDQDGQIINTYERRALLGTGGFAECYEVIDIRTKKRYAAKTIDKKGIADSKSRNKLLLEIKIHKRLKHRNIVDFYRVFEDRRHIYMIMQLCQNQTLKEFQKRRRRLTEFEIKVYLLQILDGIQYMHQMNIIHRDIKLGNIFINKKMELKIGDFGLSAKLKNSRDKRNTTCGTPNYIAPQILKETGHSFQVDVWAVGVIIYTLLIGKPPFECQSVQETYEKIKEAKFQFPKEIYVSEEAKSLIFGILRKRPENRFTIDEIRHHPFLNRKLNKLPELLPAYTISIPPEGQFLRQYIPDLVVKSHIQPRRISRMDNKQNKIRNYNSNSKIFKENKKLFLSNQNILPKQKSQLNKAAFFQKRSRILTQFTSKKSISKYDSPAKSIESDRIDAYIDFSTRYGIGYKLRSGSVGIIYNDNTSLTRINPKLFIYFDKRQSKYEVVPTTLKKKADILKMVEKDLDIKSFKINFGSSTYVKKVIVYQHMIVFKLSCNALQFFWNKETILLKQYQHIVWRLANTKGEASINSNIYQKDVLQKVDEIKKFLLSYSQRKLSRF